MKKPLLVGLVLFFFSSMINCIPDAPHGNPLDPYHDRNPGLDISGQIFQKNSTSMPLDSCTILLIPGNYFTTSDVSGQFYFNNIIPGYYELITSRTHYKIDTTYFHTDTIQSKLLIVHLNGLPFINRLYFYSQFIDQWWPDPYYAIEMNLIPSDPDGIGDIQEIKLSIPELGMFYPLTVTSRLDSFTVSILGTDFPNENIFEVIGREVFVELSDRSGSTQRFGPFFIHRIIDNPPMITAPTGLATVNSQPLLKWQAYPALFNFQFEIQVFYIVAGIPVLIHTRSEIPSSQLEYQYPEILQPGQYFWVVRVCDELGNFSRSKEASFQVQ